MLPSELLDLFRVEMNDAKKPYLWSDEFVIGAIDDAHKQFARRTDGIPDSTTPEVTVLPVVPGTDILALHPTIKKIRSARRSDNGRPVDVINQEDMTPRGLYFDGRLGPVRALVLGMDDNQVRVWPMPDETVDVLLSVFRLPLATITDDEPFEIPEQHHRHLLLWAKHLAYSVQDAETFDKTKAAEFEQRFLNYCDRAAAEQAKARHKTRVVAYGGI